MSEMTVYKSASQLEGMTIDRKTIREFLDDYLDQRAVGATTRRDILDTFVALPYNEEMAGRWNDPSTDYPVGPLNGLVIALRGHVVDWCSKNAPRAFFVPMFDGSLD